MWVSGDLCALMIILFHFRRIKFEVKKGGVAGMNSKCSMDQLDGQLVLH